MAWWNNIKTGRRGSVIAGLSGRAKELRTNFASEADALAAATSISRSLLPTAAPT